MVKIAAFHAADPGSIPGVGVYLAIFVEYRLADVAKLVKASIL